MKQEVNKTLHVGGISNCLFDVNTVLHTKDGRKIGNALIIDKDDNYNIIKTDYGNECKFTDNEIDEYFYIAYSDLMGEEKEYMLEMLGEHKNSKK